MNSSVFSGSRCLLGARRWRRWGAYVCALLLGCLLTMVPTLPASAQSVITWDDLESQSTSLKNPYEHLSSDQTYRLSSLFQLQHWIEENQPKPDSKEAQEVERLARSLADQGLDVEALLAQVEQAQAYWRSQSQTTNANLENRSVRLSGYVLPLSENSAQQVTQFLLVPYVGACIHVPPPPPNQMIYVKPPAAIENPGLFSPISVEGQIHQQPGDYELFRVDGSQSVKVSYAMTMTAIMPNSTVPSASTQFTGPWWQTLPARISGTLTQALSQLQNQRSPQTFAFAMLLSFGYGVLHTLGPGHGKAVIISYFVGKDGSLRRGLIMGVRIAIFHVFSAIVVVVLTDTVVRQSGGSAAANYRVVQLISYGAIALIGGWMLRQALQSVKGDRRLQATYPRTLGADAADSVLYPSLSQQIFEQTEPPALERSLPVSQWPVSQWPASHLLSTDCSCLTCDDSQNVGSWLALAVGAVPCSGALLVLIYGLANNLLWPSVAMVVAISVGMALTLSWIGMMAIIGNRWGQQFAERRLANPQAKISGLKQQLSLLHMGRIVGASCVCMLGLGLFGLTLITGR